MGIKVSIKDLAQASSQRDIIEKSQPFGELAMILDKSFGFLKSQVSHAVKKIVNTLLTDALRSQLR